MLLVIPVYWSITAPVAIVAPATPTAPAAPTLASGNGQLEVAWTAPVDNGSAITDYDIRYRQSGYSMWEGIYDGGTSTGSITNKTSDGPGGNPIDLGTIASGLDVTLTRESIGDNHGVYKLGSAVDGLSIKLIGVMRSSGTVSARYAMTKPTVSTLASHGNQLWSTVSSDFASLNPIPGVRPWGVANSGFGGFNPVNGSGVTPPLQSPWIPQVSFGGFNPFNGSGVTPPLPAGSYIWLETAAAETFSTLTYELSADLATTATKKTISALTNGKSYQVQVRASNATGDSDWSTAVTAVVGAPGTPSAPTLTNDDSQISISWIAPADNSSAITDYDIRYSSDGGGTWSEYFDGGMTSGTNTTSDTSNGPGGDPIDLGEITGLSVPVTRETVGADEAMGGNHGIYKLGGAVDKLYFQVLSHYTPVLIHNFWRLPQSNNFWQLPQSNNPATIQARYSLIKPTTQNLTTHGTQLWNRVAAFGFPNYAATGAAYTPPLAADTYFWVTTSKTETVVDSKWTIYADIASTATSATITGLTEGTTYQVQVRATNSYGDGSWSPSSAPTTVGAPEVPPEPATPVQSPGAGVRAPEGVFCVFAVADIKTLPGSGRLRECYRSTSDHHLRVQCRVCSINVQYDGKIQSLVAGKCCRAARSTPGSTIRWACLPLMDTHASTWTRGLVMPASR